MLGNGVKSIGIDAPSKQSLIEGDEQSDPKERHEKVHCLEVQEHKVHDLEWWEGGREGERERGREGRRGREGGREGGREKERDEVIVNPMFVP